jgi:hypothetical protein
VASDLNTLPGSQVAVEGFALFFEILSCGDKEGVLGLAALCQFGDTSLEVGYRKFKIKRLDVHESGVFGMKERDQWMMTGVFRETSGKISRRSSVESTYPPGIGAGGGVGAVTAGVLVATFMVNAFVIMVLLATAFVPFRFRAGTSVGAVTGGGAE